jgi:hypothetical protein
MLQQHTGASAAAGGAFAGVSYHHLGTYRDLGLVL